MHKIKNVAEMVLAIKSNACALRINHNLLISQPILLSFFLIVNAKVCAINPENASLIWVYFVTSTNMERGNASPI